MQRGHIATWHGQRFKAERGRVYRLNQQGGVYYALRLELEHVTEPDWTVERGKDRNE